MGGPDNLLMDTKHSNPLLGTREYQVHLGDGTVERYTANVIAEIIYAQCDSEGRYYALLDEITDHMVNNTDAEMAVSPLHPTWFLAVAEVCVWTESKGSMTAPYSHENCN